MIAGVDGYKKGWIAAIDDGQSITIRAFASFSEIVGYPGLDLVVIDIPIGLVDTGIRKADFQARRLLKARACCIFNAPLRPILNCTGHKEALSILRSLGEKGITAQGWGIGKKIREVDMVLRTEPGLQSRIREGHPECSFAVMNGGAALPFGKHTPQGEVGRLELLRSHFRNEVERCLLGIPKSVRNDVIDAFAMLWTGKRVANGCHQILGGEIDSYGIRAEILA
jgi:predicted RNase H-like nuclease